MPVSQPKLHVAILENDIVRREQIIMGLMKFRPIAISFCAGTGIEFLRRFHSDNVDLIILSLYGPGIKGIEIIEQLRIKDKSVRILCIAPVYQSDIKSYLQVIGVDGYCKNDVKDIVIAAHMILEEGTYFEANYFKLWSRNPLKIDFESDRLLANLSVNDLRIILLTVKGYTNKEIGEELSLSKRTIDTYMRNILLKLKLDFKNQLIKFAKDNNIS